LFRWGKCESLKHAVVLELEDIILSFIHTADIHLGKTYRTATDEAERLAASFSASMGSSGSRKNDSGEHFCPLGMHTHLRKVMFSSSQVTNMVNSFMTYYVIQLGYDPDAE